MNKKSFVWNMIGSAVYAAATILFVMIAKRCAGEEAGSQFYMAFTTGQMLLTIGYFEIRPFQSTDVQFQYKACDYMGFRMITCALMLAGGLVVGAIYAVFQQAGVFEVMLILALTVYKAFDAGADVFEGEFQRREHMELAGKSMTIRVVAALVLFTLVCVIWKNVLASSLAAVAAAAICLISTDMVWIKGFETGRLKASFSRVKGLFSSTILLFLGSAMCMWIWNGTKYVVEWTMDSKSTLVYGIVFMPTMVINLGSGFLLKPMLTTLAKGYTERKLGLFIKTLGILCAGITALTMVVLIGAWLVGIPILSLIYNIELEEYRMVLMWLLIGGGLNAMGIVFYYALTVMRDMKMIFAGYIVTFIISIGLPIYMTQQLGLTGAAYSYVILMVLQLLVFALMTGVQLLLTAKGMKNPGETSI